MLPYRTHKMHFREKDVINVMLRFLPKRYRFGKTRASVIGAKIFLLQLEQNLFKAKSWEDLEKTAKSNQCKTKKCQAI